MLPRSVVAKSSHNFIYGMQYDVTMLTFLVPCLVHWVSLGLLGWHPALLFPMDLLKSKVDDITPQNGAPTLETGIFRVFQVEES